MAADQQRCDGGETREPEMMELMSDASLKLQTGLRWQVLFTAAKGRWP